LKFDSTYYKNKEHGIVFWTEDGHMDTGEYKDGKFFGKATVYHTDGKIENCTEGGLHMDVQSKPELIWYKETRAVNAMSHT
jgi:hypothetical protein